MYNDIIDLAMDQQLISAKNAKVKTDYKRLPIWKELHSKTEQEIRAFEDKLENENYISFNRLFNEPLGYYFFTLYLQSQHSIDKAVFIRDVELFKSLRNYSSRKEALYQIFFTFCAPESPSRIKGTSCIENNKDIHNTHHTTKSTNSEVSKSGSLQMSITGKITDPVSEITELSSNHVSNSNQIFCSSINNNIIEYNKQNTLKIEVGLKIDNSDNIQISKQNVLADSEEETKEEKKEDKERINAMFFIDDSNAIGCTGKPLKKLKERMICGDADINIFDQVIKQILTDLKLDIFPRFIKSSLFDMYLQCKLLIELKEISISSFYSMRMLGRGAFGSVNACMKKNTGKLYAMKQIDKRRVQETDSVASLLSEKEFLSLMDSKFVTSLKYSFMDNNTIYLIMDLMSGGDLKYHLNQDGIFEENRARFYCAQILLGLQHIHSKNIIYRDLKLENVLVDACGNIKISDLGLAISQTSNNYIRGYAGTPGYTAPRVVLTQYYDQVVDFFSFGVIIYRSISGRKPFGNRMKKKLHINENKRASNRNQSVELDRNVVEINPPFDSSRFTTRSRNLCRGLLQKNSENRLGSNGYDEIKQHPFFDCIDWGLLENGYLKPPFVPVYDEIYAEQQRNLGRPPKDDKYSKIQIKKEFNESLKGFAYKSSKIIQTEFVELLKQAYYDQKKQSKQSDTFDLNQFVFPSPYEEVTKRHCLAACVIV